MYLTSCDGVMFYFQVNIGQGHTEGHEPVQNTPYKCWEKHHQSYIDYSLKWHPKAILEIRIFCDDASIVWTDVSLFIHRMENTDENTVGTKSTIQIEDI